MCNRCGDCCQRVYLFRIAESIEETKAYGEFLQFTRPGTFACLPDGLMAKVRCEHLADGNVCRVYEDRPKICREFLCERARGTNPIPATHKEDAMKLNVAERFVLLDALPREGNLKTIRTVRDIRALVELTSEEFTDFEITQAGENIRWNPDKAVEKEIDLTAPMVSQIVQALQELDNKGKLTSNHFSLCEKFDLGK